MRGCGAVGCVRGVEKQSVAVRARCVQNVDAENGCKNQSSASTLTALGGLKICGLI